VLCDYAQPRLLGCHQTPTHTNFLRLCAPCCSSTHLARSFLIPPLSAAVRKKAIGDKGLAITLLRLLRQRCVFYTHKIHQFVRKGAGAQFVWSLSGGAFKNRLLLCQVMFRRHTCKLKQSGSSRSAWEPSSGALRLWTRSVRYCISRGAWNEILTKFTRMVSSSFTLVTG
jgi:hypothetical protein